MEEDPENGKDSSHSAHANGMNEQTHTHNFRKAKMEVYSYRTAPVRYFGVILGHSQRKLGGRNCRSQTSIPLKLLGPINKLWHLKKEHLQSSSYICFFSLDTKMTSSWVNISTVGHKKVKY
jgi:hypothetical protein